MTNFSLSSGLSATAAAVALAVLPAGCNPKDGVREYKQGCAAYEAGNLEKAGRFFAQSVAYAPSNVDALVMCARVQCDRGEIDAAAQTIARATDLAGSSPDVALLDAEIAFYGHDYERATRRFTGVAEDKTASPEIQAMGWTGLGIVEMATDRSDRRDYARLAFLKAIRLDRRNAPARYHLALLYRGDSYGYLDAALDQFEIFVRLGEKSDPRALHVQRVVIPAIKEDIARRAAERGAGHRNAAAAAAALARAEEAWKKKNYKAARDEYAAAAKEDPLSYPAFLGLAQSWEKADETPSGRRRTLDSYREACTLRPGAVVTFLKTGEIAERLGQQATAAEVYSRAVAANPNNISAIDGLIRALNKTGKSKIAAAYQRYREMVAPPRKPAK